MNQIPLSLAQKANTMVPGDSVHLTEHIALRCVESHPYDSAFRCRLCAFYGIACSRVKCLAGQQPAGLDRPRPTDVSFNLYFE